LTVSSVLAVSVSWIVTFCRLFQAGERAAQMAA
jgi:hypothetical protein